MLEISIWARLDLNLSWASKLVEGKDFWFTGKIKYYRFNEKSPTILQLEVEYEAYRIAFKWFSWFREEERLPEKVVKWIDADKITIYEETILKCKKVTNV